MMVRRAGVCRFAAALGVLLCAAGFLFAAEDGVRTPGAAAAPASAPFLRLVPPAPIPVRPASGDTVLTVAPILEVESPVPAPWFHFRVMEEASVAAEGFSPVPYWSPALVGVELQRGHRYRWSCRVRDFAGWSPWFCPEHEFVVGFSLSAPEPKLPQDGATVATLRPLFVVKPVPVPAVYRFRVSGGKTLKGEGTSDLPMWVYEGEPLEWGNRYEWSCRVETPHDTSGWFEPGWSFETATVPATDGVVEGEGLSWPAVRPEPNPFREQVRLSIPAGGPYQVRIHDVSGRCVRALREGGAGPGEGEAGFVWDGRDQYNRVVGPGTYFCRVAGPDGSRTFTFAKVD